MIVKIYKYKKSSGAYLSSDTGHPKYLIMDIPSDADFTLTPPPDARERWYWIDNKWVADDTAS